MSNIQNLRNDLLTCFEEIKDGTLPLKEAEAMNNTAGKIVQTVITEMKYADLRKEKPHIPFLDNPKKQISD